MNPPSGSKYRDRESTHHPSAAIIGVIVSLRAVGYRAGTPDEVAAVFQAFLDPRFETFHYDYVKDGRIVAHEAVTTGLPHASSNLREKGPDFQTAFAKHRPRR